MFFGKPHERRSGVVINALDSGLKGPGSSTGRVLCPWARHFTLTVPFSRSIHGPANYKENPTKCWGVNCDGLASHPGRAAILLVASCCGNRDKLLIRRNVLIKPL